MNGNIMELIAKVLEFFTPYDFDTGNVE